MSKLETYQKTRVNEKKMPLYFFHMKEVHRKSNSLFSENEEHKTKKYAIIPFYKDISTLE